MDVEEYKARILGKKIDMSIHHKDADENAFLFRVTTMPFKDTLVRLAHEIHPTSGDVPCYLQNDGEDAVHIGYMDNTLEKVSTCKSILDYSLDGVYWVEKGVIVKEVDYEDLMKTVKFKKGGNISEYI